MNDLNPSILSAMADAAAADGDMEGRSSQAKDLVSQEALKTLMLRSNRKAWLQTLSYFGAIGVTGYALRTLWGSWWAVPLFILQGALLAFLYAAQHEFSHLTAFRTRSLNVVWGHICGWLGFFPYYMDRCHHMVHHQYTGIRGQDQELEDFRFEDKPHTLGSYLLWISAIGYFPFMIKTILGRLVGKCEPRELERFEEKDRIKFIVEGWWYFTLYMAVIVLSLYYQSWIALQLWIAPMVLMKWAHMLHNMAEHYGLPKVADMLSNTRTIYTTPFNRWLVWNMTYHTAHHRFANVPFYNLKELDRLIRPQVKHSTLGYIPFHKKVLRCALRGKRFGYEGLM